MYLKAKIYIKEASNSSRKIINIINLKKSNIFISNSSIINKVHITKKLLTYIFCCVFLIVLL